MKFNFKKIAPILAGAILLGSTMGAAIVAADLGSYPAPFVSGGVADVTIVYGSDGMAIDMEAIALFTGDLATELASQTAEAGDGEKVLSGESQDLSINSRRLFFADELNTARDKISAEHLPTILASGIVTDKSGTTYTYDQSIALSTGGVVVSFGKSGETIDPVVHLNLTTAGAGQNVGLYNHTITFGKDLQVNSTDVYGYATIVLQGKNFLIGPDSTYSQLILYGAGTTVRATEAEEQTITLNDIEHTVLLEGTSATDTAHINLDGTAKAVTEGSSYSFAGDVIVYIKTIFHTTKTGASSWVDLVIGTKKLTLESGKAVTYLKEGVTTTMLNTRVRIDGEATTNKISEISVEQAAESSTHDYIALGENYVDRIFGGVKLDFSSVTPALDSAARDVVTIDTDNCMQTYVKFTSYYAGAGGGELAPDGPEATLGYGRDSDQSCTSGDVTPVLTWTNNKTIHILENETMKIGELVVVNAGDHGMIWKLISAGAGTSASDSTTFRDMITLKDDIVFETGDNNYSKKFVGGGYYYVQVNEPSSDTDYSAENPKVTVSWGAAASYNNPGTQTTLYPRIKLKKGGWLAIMDEQLLVNGTTYILPGDELLSDYETGAAIHDGNPNASSGGGIIYTHYEAGTYGSITFGYMNYTLNNASGVWNFIGISGKTATAGRADCNFNSTINAQTGPAIVLVEEKQIGLGETDGRGVCVPLTTWSTGPTRIAIGEPVFLYGTETPEIYTAFSAKLTPESHLSYAIDRYGTFVEYGKAVNTGYKVTLYYPDEMMTADIFLAEIAAEAAVTEVTATGVVALGDVILSDTEAEAASPLTNLIVVGDAAVNKVAFELVKDEAAEAGLTYPVYGEGLTTLYGYGADQAIAKLFTSPYSAAKKAMLVAGWEGPDTVAAAKQVIDKTTGLVGLDEKVITKGVDYT